MNFRIPAWAVTLWETFVEFINVPIYRRVRRIDVLLAVLLIACMLYYYFTAGWLTSIASGLLFVVIMMAALWML